MSQGAHVDSAALRGFATRLTRFAEQVAGEAAHLRAAVSRLGDSWQDQEFHHFFDQFRSTEAILSKFVEEANRIAPILEKDAEVVERYGKQSR